MFRYLIPDELLSPKRFSRAARSSQVVVVRTLKGCRRQARLGNEPARTRSAGGGRTDVCACSRAGHFGARRRGSIHVMIFDAL